MLINLSNHPYEQWGDLQKKVASLYGDTVDLPFPTVDPGTTEEEIGRLAEEYLGKVLEFGEPSELTVHIMGEHTLCHTLINRLIQLDIQCVASCSARDVTIQPNGSKLVNFNFIRFRRYI